MDSIPPATTIELFPVCTACAARATAFNPEPQTLLIVMAPVAGDNPPKIAACRAGFWPSPAETTLPMMHSSTMAGAMPARRTASRTTIAPSCGAANVFSAPRNLPVGVRTAATMTASGMVSNDDARDVAVAEHRLQAREDHRLRPIELARPLRARGLDDQRAVLEFDRARPIERRADRRAPRERHLSIAQRRVVQEQTQAARHGVGEGFHPVDLIIASCA